jgi:hypothetical protein
MVGELITLPVRIGVRATGLWLRAAEQAIGVAANAAGRLIDVAIPRASARPDAGGRQPPSTPGTTASARATQVPAREPAATGRPAPGAPTAQGAPTVQAAPSATPDPPPVEALETLVGGEPHLSEEPELVEEFSEPGAEDGAGAEIHVDQPWDGYRQMNAKDVIARLAAATPAELAAVQLYEGGSRRRQTILAAAQRALRSASGGGQQS